MTLFVLGVPRWCQHGPIRSSTVASHRHENQNAQPILAQPGYGVGMGQVNQDMVLRGLPKGCFRTIVKRAWSRPVDGRHHPPMSRDIVPLLSIHEHRDASFQESSPYAG